MITNVTTNDGSVLCKIDTADQAKSDEVIMYLTVGMYTTKWVGIENRVLEFIAQICLSKNAPTEGVYAIVGGMRNFGHRTKAITDVLNQMFYETAFNDFRKLIGGKIKTLNKASEARNRIAHGKVCIISGEIKFVPFFDTLSIVRERYLRSIGRFRGSVKQPVYWDFTVLRAECEIIDEALVVVDSMFDDLKSFYQTYEREICAQTFMTSDDGLPISPVPSSSDPIDQSKLMG